MDIGQFILFNGNPVQIPDGAEWVGETSDPEEDLCEECEGYVDGEIRLPCICGVGDDYVEKQKAMTTFFRRDQTSVQNLTL